MINTIKCEKKIQKTKKNKSSVLRDRDTVLPSAGHLESMHRCKRKRDIFKQTFFFWLQSELYK